jgi:hypothetical protein
MKKQLWPTRNSYLYTFGRPLLPDKDLISSVLNRFLLLRDEFHTLSRDDICDINEVQYEKGRVEDDPA